MKSDVKQKWLERLRSGEIVQGRGRLRLDDDRMCCLGVLCEVAVAERVIEPPVMRDVDTFTDNDSGVTRQCYTYFEKGNNADIPAFAWTGALPVKVMEWAGITNHTHYAFPQAGHLPNLGSAQDVLIHMNDSSGLGFNEIADWIEDNL